MDAKTCWYQALTEFTTTKISSDIYIYSCDLPSLNSIWLLRLINDQALVCIYNSYIFARTHLFLRKCKSDSCFLQVGNAFPIKPKNIKWQHSNLLSVKHIIKKKTINKLFSATESQEIVVCYEILCPPGVTKITPVWPYSHSSIPFECCNPTFKPSLKFSNKKLHWANFWRV